MSKATHILVVDPDAQFASHVVALLAERGLEACAVTSMSAALAQARPALLICAAALDDGSAVQLLARFEQDGHACPAVLSAKSSSVDECTAAMRAGVREFFLQPFTIPELIEGVLRVLPKPALPGRARLCLESSAEIEANARAVRELLAFLILHGFAAAARARIAGATAEVLENVARHAYPDADGSFRLEATLLGRQLRVEITDDGIGCELNSPGQTGCATSAVSGLVRASALAENFKLSNRPEGGMRAVLEFNRASFLFADERGVDLSDLDYLEPLTARRLLASLGDDAAPQFQLSPAIAVCVGRILSAAHPAKSPLAALRS